MINQLRPIFAEWQYQWQQEGWQAIPSILRELFALPYSYTRFIIVARSLEKPLPTLQAKIPLEVRPFNESDLAALPDIMEHPDQVRECRLRLERGHVGYVALHKGELVGYSWACAEVVPSLEDVPIELEPGDMLCVDSFTAPEFRSKGIQTVLGIKRLRHFQELGYKRALGYIESHNAASSASWRKKGSEVIGLITYQRIGLWRHVWRQPASAVKRVLAGQNS